MLMPDSNNWRNQITINSKLQYPSVLNVPAVRMHRYTGIIQNKLLNSTAQSNKLWLVRGKYTCKHLFKTIWQSYELNGFKAMHFFNYKSAKEAAI